MSDPKSGSSSTPDSIHWRSLIAAMAAIAAVGIAIGLGLPLLSIIMEKRGIPPTLIGLNSAMAGVASMLCAPFTARLAHRYSTSSVMVAAIVLSAASSLGFYYIQNFWLWFPLRIVFHGATTMVFILSEFWINAAAPPRRRGLVLGIYATVLALGFANGPLLFSLLGSDGPLPFAVGAFVILLAAVPILIARKESPDIDEKPEMHFMRYILLVPTATAAVFVFGAVQVGGLSLFPVYATRAGFTESQAALLLTVMGVGNFLFQIPLGLLSDHMKDRRKLLSIMALVGMVGAASLPLLSQNWLLMAVVLLFWGGCVSGLYTVGLSHLGSRLTGADLAAANAAFIFCYAVGTVAGPQVVGVAIDVAGDDGFAWSIAFFFGLYVALSLARMVFRPKRA
ncbi:MFS family permease [Rhizobium azooxidifex]|uniref:MFS family permease n=1 Tax=Mycoplana azooxidifex TaxID=1636188 RepID=A0A7W6DFN4_9HYPH|nr:MFS transporter [Mycoplana azooxidifex]MBB3978104.1 MFS family permease [Mycoplana azooxidifex]